MEKTNLNVSPYYDDFAESKDFHRVLFRPGFAVQARELTQLQSILQNQIEKHGRHMFKEGTVVIPGSVGFTNEFYAVKLDSTLSGTDISAQIQDYVGKRITGSTSGVVAEVIKVDAATTNDPITLYVKYIRTGSDNVTTVFANGERISANGTVGSFGSGVDSAQLNATNATATGSSANIEEGVYFIRGHFVRVAEQRIVLDKYTDTPSYRVGLSIQESLETPEEDTSLLDNAQGTSNANAKGAHRLKFTLTLSKLALDSTADENFVELIRIDNGIIKEKARNTEYSVLGDTLARRTFDESGDYTVRDFQIDIRENANDGLNNGIYSIGATTDDGNTASDDFLSVQLSPGKAYVRGYEIETVSPKYIDVLKPRTFENYNAAVTPQEVGNFVVVNKVHGQPELTPLISGEIDQPYREIALHDQQTGTRGTAAGNKIGFARARAFEHFEGNTGSSAHILAGASTTDTTFKLYLFDIRMFTTLTMSGTPSPAATTGAKITGVNSGAHGYVASASSGTALVLTSVVGTFTPGEKVTSTSSTESDEILENSSNADLTIASITVNDFSAVKQVHMNDPDTGDADFSGDVVLSNNITLAGLVTYGGSGTTVNGFQTDFTTELKVGDIIALPTGAAGALEERRVTAVTNNTTITISAAMTNGVTSVAATRKRAQLTDQNKNILLRKLQKGGIKTLKTENNSGVSDTSVVVRRSFEDVSTVGGQVSFSAGANETFNAISNTDFVLVVITAGGGSAADGDIINLNSSNVTVAGSGTNTLTITSSALLGNAAEVRLIATLTRTTVNEKTKTRNRMKMVLVDNDGVAGGAAYGTSAHHKDISLGFADVFKVHAIYDSEDANADPTLPQWTITGASGSFTKGELITGATSGAIARIVNPISPITYVPVNGADFTAGETISGAESTNTATLDTFTDGSRDVTISFTTDTGQRDNFYDVGRIVRKAAAATPTGRLLVVFDNFDHGSGDFFTVDSYSSINYKDIPTYSATRVDPEVAEPTGEYDLGDSVDFRPRVADATTSTSTIQSQTAHKVTSMSFNFEDRNFAGTGSSTIDIPKDNSNFLYDFDFYVGRIDLLYLTPLGDFKIVKGADAEVAAPPKGLDDAMKIAQINLNPFVKSTDDVNFIRVNNRRYTMRDIGKLETRINNVEYYTALNMLETAAQSTEITDANGLNRFKSGILVDNFRGHKTGDAQHPDYRAAIDMENAELRPKYYMKGVTLVEDNITDADRTNDQYQKTGDILTLPYEHHIAASQPYATRVENLNPVLNFAWAGICVLSPSGDEWFEVNKLPDIIINREGNFDTVFAQNRNAIGTVWGAWQSQWGGRVTVTSQTVREHRFINLGQPRGRAVLSRTIVQAEDGGPVLRRGVNTQVIPQIDMESQGDRVLSRALIPFIRARNVTFTVTGMKPLTKVYPFFDKTLVTNQVTPTGGSTGGDLVTSAAGRISGVFAIPDPNVRGNPQFRTGDRVFRLTSSPTNTITPEPETFAQATYSATGILTTTQETFIATRNARVVTRSVQETANSGIIRQRVVGWWDPLAQSFMPQAEGGEFLTKVDAFFSQKDEDLPVTCQIREMDNGYPTTKVLPFASKVLAPFHDGTVAIANGSGLVTGTNTNFLEFEVGQTITVYGAGNETVPAEMTTLGGASGNGALVTKIASITSATSMTLNDSAKRAVSGVKISEVNHSNGADSRPTTFKFDAPVYVKNGVEYCIVLQTDSNKYFAWISRMGEVDVGGSRLVSEQPYLGVLFKSQNNTTWTAYDFEDLKFNLYRAKFDTSKTGTITLNNDVLPSKNLEANAIRTINGQSFVKVTHRDHHMYDTDNNLTISGVSSGINSTLNGAITNSATSLTLSSSSGFPSSGTVHLKIGSEVLSGTISGTGVSGITRGVEGTAVAHANGAAIELYQLNGIPLTEVNKTHNALANITIDGYTVSTTTNASADGTGGGSNVFITENAQMDVIQTLVPTIELPDTSLTAKVRTTSGTSPDGTQNSFTKSTLSQALPIPIGEDYHFADPKIVTSQINETLELAGDKSFNLIFTMTSDKDNISPIIDLDRKSIIAVANRLDNIDSAADLGVAALQGDFVQPTEPDGDNTEAIYCTKKVQLQTPATAIRTYLDAVKFDSAEIQVMYKVLRSDDASDFDEIGWEYFNTTGTPDTNVNASVNTEDFIERQYTVEGLSEFIAFAIKIRMQGTNTCEVPRIKDLRAIALAT